MLNRYNNQCLLASTVTRFGSILALMLASSFFVRAQSSDSSSTVHFQGNPFDVVVSRDSQWIFVSLQGNGAERTQGIAVLRAQEGRIKLQHIVRMGHSPCGLILTHDGKLLIAAAQDYVVFFSVDRLITGESGAAFQWVSDGAKAGSICVNVTDDDKTLFVSDEFTRTISVMNLDVIRSLGYDSAANFKRLSSQEGASQAIVGKIPVGGSPVALTFSSDQRLLYTTSEVAPPDLKWPRVIKQENPPRGQTPRMQPEGAVIVVDVAKAKTDAKNSVVSHIPAGGSPVRLALAPAGDRLFVAARNSNAVLVFDTTKFITDPAHAKVATIAVGKSPVPIVLIENGKMAIVGNSNRYGPDAAKASTLSVLDTAKIGTMNSPVIASIPAGAYPRNFCLSPDGRTLFLTNFVSDSLQVMDVSSLPHPEVR